jgi:signal transduction histidine kinase
MGAMESGRWTGFALVWQAALVLLPAAMLPGLAIYFLRQDRAAVEQQARDQASVLAPELARQLGERVGLALRGQPELPTGVILNGRIQSPPDYPRLPEPPEGQTPAEARAEAELQSLAAESKGGAKPGFVERCVALAQNAGAARTESGAPVADLALLLALRHAGSGPSGALMTELTHAALEHPSFMTPELLQVAGPGAGQLTSKWRSQEETLGLMRTFQARLAGEANPFEMWLWQDGRPHLAFCTPVGGGWRVALPTPDQFAGMLRDARRGSGMAVPAYAAAVVEMAGGVWSLDGPPVDLAANGRAAVLASAAGNLDMGAGPMHLHPFTMEIRLADPNLLYGSYRRRMRLLVGLMCFASGAAAAAMLGLWRNTRRQALLSEMKSNFVSSVSHELRAPIAAVRLMAESLDRGTVAEESKREDYFRLIVQECRRLSSLVENVLDFSRIDQGRKQYNFEPVEIVALARQAVALMEPCAAERQVTLTLAETAAGVEELRPRWDAHAIEQSLVNLIDNAIKHSPSGAEVRVAIELAGAALRLWVEDHGEGIPKEEQARIFDLFYRHGSELRRETQGAGIGLSIVKHVAEAHGGRVIVESALGEGSRFALELPV